MKKKRRLWIALLVCVLLAAGVAAWLEPNRVVRGWIAGEPFFRGRPAGYWAEVLRAEHDPGPPFRKVPSEFQAKDEALPVLRVCASDPDPNVRRRVAYILADGYKRPAFRDALAESLADPDAQVRLTSIQGVAAYGPSAQPCASALLPLLHDPDLQVADLAELALWEIAPESAREATGWRQFAPDGWGFSAAMPGEPQESTLSSGGPVPSVGRQFMAAQARVNQFCVAVTDFPAESPFPADDDGRLDFARNSVVLGLTAKGFKARVADETNVEVGGVKGLDFRVEVEGMGFIRTRVFWAGRRLYQVKVVSKPQFLNPKAADYFLYSFRLTDAAGQR